MAFKDRIYKSGANPNLKRVVPVAGEPNVYQITDISDNIETEGTPLNADELNAITTAEGFIGFNLGDSREEGQCTYYPLNAVYFGQEHQFDCDRIDDADYTTTIIKLKN